MALLSKIVQGTSILWTSQPKSHTIHLIANEMKNYKSFDIQGHKYGEAWKGKGIYEINIVQKIMNM